VERKNVIMMIMLNGLISPGRTSTAAVSSRPSSLMIKYSGINPPLKNIVNTMIYMKMERPFNFVLDSGYAAIVVISIASKVNTAVKPIVKTSDRTIAMSDSTRVYASNESSIGYSVTLPEVIGPLELSETAKMWRNGARQDRKSVV